MAYPPRARSEGDVYHVITRGTGQMIVFEDDQDRGYFMKLMREQAEAREIGIWAWCLMSNHMHFLMHGPLEEVSALFQSVKSRYARYFNNRHNRKGSLFQGRYTSVPIQNDEQLVSAVEYIHLNPVSAGEGLEYRWSSYKDYFDREDIASDGKEIISALMGGPAGFARSHKGTSATKVKLPRRRIGEDEAIEVAKAVLDPIGLHDVGALGKAERDAQLARLKAAGLSVRQISRLTSIGQNIVARA